MEDGKENPIARFFIIPQRIILSIMCIFAIISGYSMRICLSTAITKMVLPKNNTVESGSTEYCQPVDQGALEKEIGGTYAWSEQLQGSVLSSFYIGYIISHIPGGFMADLFGGKWVLGLGILICAIMTLLTPITVENFGPNGLMVLRIIIGFGSGPLFPSISTLLSAWVPKSERGKLATLTLGAVSMGTVVGFFFSGLMLHNWRWPVVFYVFGMFSVTWFILFSLLCYSRPSTHPFISKKEMEYLNNEMGADAKSKTMPPVPWKSILTSGPVWATIAAQLGHDWIFFVMVSDLPKYLNDVLRMSIKSNGIYTSLPYILMWIVAISSGLLCDKWIKSNSMSLTNIRKIMTAIAAFGPGMLTVAAAYVGCHWQMAVFLFTIGMGTMGPYYAGIRLNAIDMSPNYSGTLMALSNGLGSLTGVLGPYFVGVMTPNSTLSEWTNVFWLAFFIVSIFTVVYLIWGSSEIQPFNDPQNEKKDGN